MDCTIIRDNQTYKKGFTLIELMFGIVIIGIMMAAIVPMMMQREPGYERKQFAARLNTLMQRAWQNAIITNAVHRVVFNFLKREAFVEKDASKTVQADKLKFEKITAPDSSMSWPSTFLIQQFIVEGFDELRRFSGGKAETTWFYVVPNGLTQQVTINGSDRAELIEDRPARFGLVLNPYTAQFKVYDAFQK